MLDALRPSGPVVPLLAGISAVLIAGVIITVTGIRPPGESEILKQIDREDSQLCSKFGMTTGTEMFQDCMLELVNMRKRHMEMVASYDVP